MTLVRALAVSLSSFGLGVFSHVGSLLNPPNVFCSFFVWTLSICFSQILTNNPCGVNVALTAFPADPCCLPY